MTKLRIGQRPFRMLSENHKLAIVSLCPLLAEREHDVFNVKLFSVNGFFVEAYYDERAPFPIFYDCFDEHERLDAYLDRIDIRSNLNRANNEQDQ